MKHMWSEEELKAFIEEQGEGSVPLDDIVDSQGNKRFVEGNGNPTSISKLTINYNKWSLSGTHLMLVVAGVVNNDFITTKSSIISSFELPDYILDKINATFIDRKDTYFFSSELTQTTVPTILEKDANSNLLNIIIIDEKSLYQFNTFRIIFDLIIDTE